MAYEHQSGYRHVMHIAICGWDVNTFPSYIHAEADMCMEAETKKQYMYMYCLVPHILWYKYNLHT